MQTMYYVYVCFMVDITDFNQLKTFGKTLKHKLILYEFLLLKRYFFRNAIT